MSRWKFVYEKESRKDNVSFLESLSSARTLANRKLLKIYFEASTKCDGTCKHCYFYPNRLKEEMSLEEIIELQTFLQNGGVESITYAGADPISRDDHMVFIEHGQSIGLKQTFCTRGWINDIDKIRALCATSIEHIQFSCDPYLSGLSLEEELNRIETICSVTKEYSCHTSWVITLAKGSEQYLLPLVTKIHESGGKEFRIHRILPWGNILDNMSLVVSNDEFVDIMKDFVHSFFDIYTNGHLYVEETPITLRSCLSTNSDKKVTLIGCPVGQTALTISYDGMVYLCPILRHESLKLGENWRDIFDCWNSFQNTNPFCRTCFTGTACETCNDFNECLGGCRCQAVANEGGRWAVDPTCQPTMDLK